MGDRGYAEETTDDVDENEKIEEMAGRIAIRLRTLMMWVWQWDNIYGRISIVSEDPNNVGAGVTKGEYYWGRWEEIEYKCHIYIKLFWG